jgi:phosphatidylglycerophosphate synthase
VVDRFLRPVKARALAPLARAASALTPGTLTGAGLAVGLAAALCAAVGAFGAALALWLVNRLLDGVDGEVARLVHDGVRRQSDRGDFADLAADVTVYAALTLGLAAGAAPLAADPALVWAFGAVALATYYVNITALLLTASLLALRSRGRTPHDEGTMLDMPTGLIEGTETIVLLSLALALPQYAPLTLAAIAALVALTALQRGVWALRHLPGPA